MRILHSDAKTAKKRGKLTKSNVQQIVHKLYRVVTRFRRIYGGIFNCGFFKNLLLIILTSVLSGDLPKTTEEILRIKSV